MTYMLSWRWAHARVSSRLITKDLDKVTATLALLDDACDVVLRASYTEEVQ